MKKVVIFGTGSLARLVHFYLTNDSGYQVVAFTVNAEFIKSKSFCDLPIVDFEHIKDEYPPDKYDMFIALGPQNLNELRELIYSEAKKKGYKLISFISSRADYWQDLKHGDNVLIIQNSSIEPFVEIGNNVILIGSKIGYKVRLEDNCFVSTATIGSSTVVRKNAFIGINSSINPLLNIGIKSIITTGSLIHKDVDDFTIHRMD